MAILTTALIVDNRRKPCAQVAARLARDGESAELADQLVAMAASTEHLSPLIRVARERLDEEAGQRR